MASYKKSIESYCKWCIYDEVLTGSWRKQVEDCGSPECPLFEVRPLTLDTVEKQRNKKSIPVKTVS